MDQDIVFVRRAPVAVGLEAGWIVPTGLPLPVTSPKEREHGPKKLIRRFEPRYTVSQEMVDRESKYVAMEHGDYLLGSIHDLNDQLSEWLPLWRTVNQTAEALMALQGEREALAYRCMMVRDLYHIIELYCTCMRAEHPETQADQRLPSTPKTKPVKEEERLAPFAEWLFSGKAGG